MLRNNYFGETKTHYKLYKCGKNWAVMGISLFSLGLGMLVNNRPVSADVTATSTSNTVVKTDAISSSSSSAAKADENSASSSSVAKVNTTSSSATNADATSASSSSAVNADENSASSSSVAKVNTTSSSATNADAASASSNSESNSKVVQVSPDVSVSVKADTDSSSTNPLDSTSKAYILNFSLTNSSSTGNVISKGSTFNITISPDERVSWDKFLKYNSIVQSNAHFTLVDNNDGTATIKLNDDLLAGTYNFILNLYTQDAGYDWDKETGTHTTNPDPVSGEVAVDFITNGETTPIFNQAVYVKPLGYNPSPSNVQCTRICCGRK
ncbi:KxYKxGKxW signal peptide domain-containing protein [Limosilactobacillus fermentum]|uniref:KxYKxGKxW signal peptide domain-containing protein n=1 Tax=Limosilactobacillus fermentum TaxID=1613 RepID=UPI000A75C1D4|nr:KxYKxGKxW signal peptide domain-containing protein [Limosilactobacillus fermentum]